jgi:hypothetical protein
LRFLAQCAVPDAQMTTVGDVVHLVDVVTGSAATLTPVEGRWEVREGGPVGPKTFSLSFNPGGPGGSNAPRHRPCGTAASGVAHERQAETMNVGPAGRRSALELRCGHAVVVGGRRAWGTLRASCGCGEVLP